MSGPVTAKILDRIQKLLRLSRSSNEHEAALAAANAAKLMAEHDLTEAHLRVADPKLPGEAVEDLVIERRRTKVSWRGRIAQGVATSMSCHMYFEGNDGTIRIVGRPSHVTAVSYTFQYLCREVDRLADAIWEVEQYNAYDPVRPWKNAFRMGAADTIFTRLTTDADARQKAAEASTSTAMVLVRADAQALQDFVAKLGLKKGKRIKIRAPGGFEHGQKAGKTVSLGGARAALGTGQGRLK